MQGEGGKGIRKEKSVCVCSTGINVIFTFYSFGGGYMSCVCVGVVAPACYGTHVEVRKQSQVSVLLLVTAYPRLAGHELLGDACLLSLLPIWSWKPWD